MWLTLLETRNISCHSKEFLTICCLDLAKHTLHMNIIAGLPKAKMLDKLNPIPVDRLKECSDDLVHKKIRIPPREHIGGY